MKTTFEKILVPLDLTDKHKEAMAITAELAKQSGGAVVLLHVVETIPGLTELEEKDFYTRLERTAQTHLESFAASLTGPRHSLLDPGGFGPPRPRNRGARKADSGRPDHPHNSSVRPGAPHWWLEQHELEDWPNGTVPGIVG